MGRIKKTRAAPAWAVENNPASKFFFVYIDLLKAKKFLELSRPAQLFYIFCLGNAHDDKGRACLKNHIRERNLLQGKDEYTDIDFYLNNGYFVFPAKHLERFGYSRQYAYKLMNELIDAGFIEKKEQNNSCMKVNVYCFSTRWKNKTSATSS